MQNNWRNSYLRYKDFFLNTLRVYRSRPDIKSFLEMILSLTTIIIFSLFAIKPTVITIIELNKTIKTKEDTLAKLDQKITNLETANSVLQNQTVNLPFIYQAVPQTAEVESVVGQIQGYAQNSQIELLGVSSSEIFLIGENTKKRKDDDNLPQGAKQLPITISATGNYEGLYNFIKNLENLRRPIKIDMFSFNSSKTKDDQTLVATLTGRMPYEKGITQ